MARLAEADIRRIIGFLTSASRGDFGEPLPMDTLVALRDLIGADDAEYFELRRADRGVVAHTETNWNPSAPGSDEVLRMHPAQNPLSWRRWHPSDGAMRLSARISRRALERLEFHQGFLRPNRLTDNLKVWLHSTPESAACVQLWRMGGEFSVRDEDMLSALHHHLIRLRAEAIDGHVAGGKRTTTLTRREAEILSWAVRGESDTSIAERIGASPATVGKHLEHAFAALGVHSRAEALWHLTERLAPESRHNGARSSSVVGSEGDPES